jgi:hypothetical protein
MICYRLAGQVFYFSYPVLELKPFEVSSTQQGTAEQAVPFVPHSFLKKESNVLSPVPATTSFACQTVGWVGGAERLVEVVDTPRGILLKVAGGGEFFIAPRGDTIRKANPPEELSQLDREIIAGPALVLALALRGVWSLHASAVLYKDKGLVFLGESRQGKSTLAAYCSQNPGWRLVADDILPVTMVPDHLIAWPHFPQLKLAVDAQPGPSLPEQLPISVVCMMTDTDKDDQLELKLLPAGEAVQVLLGHTAGTRMFDPDLLARHLAFCSEAAERVPVYRLTYPQRWEALPRIKDLLEHIC